MPLLDPLTVYILIGCSAALLVFMITCICILCLRKKKNKRKVTTLKKEQETVEMDSLLFVYERNTEKQQSPPIRYPASCPASPPSDKDSGGKTIV